MKLSALSVIKEFMTSHNIDHNDSLDEDLSGYILDACSGFIESTILSLNITMLFV